MHTEIVQLDGNLEKIQKAFKTSPIPFPTETVYGLGASVWDEDMIKRVFKIKNRPTDNPLIIHVSSLEMVTQCIEGPIPEIYTEVIDLYWPGPLTLLFKKNKRIPEIVSAGGEYVAIRMPAHKDAIRLIEYLNYPIVGPSANKSTRPSPTSAQHVLDDLGGEVPLIIDGGVCEEGVESTVINALHNPPLLLRPGVISYEQIKEIVPEIELLSNTTKEEGKASPGTRYKHYSPTAPVTMIQGSKTDILRKINCIKGKSVGLLATEEYTKGLDKDILIYSLGADTKTSAKRLFDGLRYLDRHVSEIYTIEIESTFEGRAVMDRLNRATSKWI